MNVFEVFTPTDTPTVTYVDRRDRALEAALRNALRTPKMITSLSGPSKSGKTVLIKKVLDPDSLISISGAAIKSADDLWNRVLNWMDAPSEQTKSSDHEVTLKAEAKGGGKVKIPLIAEGAAEASAGGEYAYGRGTEARHTRGGIDQVIKEIAGGDFVLFIDDYHYMDRDVQAEVARQLKEAAEAGVKICTASVPHRKDDVLRGNSELRGRVQAIDFEYWLPGEIEQIVTQGFSALNVDLPKENRARLVQESFGSPQLMQQICLQTCLRANIENTLPEKQEIVFTKDAIESVLEQASTTTDFSSLLEGLHNGPKPRGAPRNQFHFNDGTRGDVYRCILLAFKCDPPRLAYSYDDIYQLTRRVCIEEAPPGSSIASALEQLPQLAENLEPRSQIIEWSDDVFDIVDPYFLYFLRCSSKLKNLAKT
ncbi:hypothetical protein OMW55_04830 [Sphingomonas sp. BN140010]|uniref:AAA+ ATPase domain-containing protein n=1 Tax=Sphingomonas arvum TaxID=2992113 RepID=A0ABT3JDL6_9SPHN|nr:hypothetical protein [Sphingomonas sp. BN140010]MCW3797131.1 hypothetical protein [Sphingomonas sp. BN140010]